MRAIEDFREWLRGLSNDEIKAMLTETGAEVSDDQPGVVELLEDEKDFLDFLDYMRRLYKEII